MPQVTVIVPIYGVEQYIERCARSLFEQTLSDIEYVFVNDCTPDNSVEILNKVLSEYPERKDNVIIVNHEVNKGLPIARKTGLFHASGEYIIHCDSDDWVELDAYERMYSIAKSEGVDIISCDYYRSSDSSRSTIHLEEKTILLKGPIWNRMVKHTIYDKPIMYPTAGKAEDGALMMQLSFYAIKRKHISAPLYNYFINENSMCGNKDLSHSLIRMKQEIENTELRIKFLQDNDALQTFKDEVTIWKYTARNNILPFIRDTKYYNIWRSTYPEIHRDILFSKKISLRTKIKYLLRYYRVILH